MRGVLLVIAQSFLSFFVGFLVFSFLIKKSCSKYERFFIGALLMLSWFATGIVLIPSSPMINGRIGPVHLVSYFLSGSWFLVMTRLLFFTATGDSHGLWKEEEIVVFVAVYFTAPLAVASYKPTNGVFQRHLESLDRPLWRAVGKTIALVLILRNAVLPFEELLQNSLAYTTLASGAVMYLTLSGIEDAFAFVLETLFSLEMKPTFCEPWLSTSFREFWAFRWHSPFRDCNVGVLRVVGSSRNARLFGSFLVFAFSGLCHLFQVWVTLRILDWYMLCFFLVAFFQISCDGILKRLVPHDTQRRLLVVTILYMTSALFWKNLWKAHFLVEFARIF